MKGTIKLAVLGAAALAASSTAALAGSELPSGALTGLALGAPLPEGVYALNIESYGSGGNRALGTANVAYSAPLWLLWSTPWQIAGGRVAFSTYTGVADVWTPGGPVGDSFLNTLVEGHLGWNLHNGFNVSVYAGAWLPSTQSVPMLLGRDYTAFQGLAAVSYIANGWNLTATTGYGSGGGGTRRHRHQQHVAVLICHARPDRCQEVRQARTRLDRIRVLGPRRPEGRSLRSRRPCWLRLRLLRRPG